MHMHVFPILFYIFKDYKIWIFFVACESSSLSRTYYIMVFYKFNL